MCSTWMSKHTPKLSWIKAMTAMINRWMINGRITLATCCSLLLIFQSAQALEALSEQVLSEVTGQRFAPSTISDSGIELSGQVHILKQDSTGVLLDTPCSNRLDLYCGADLVLQPRADSGWIGLTHMHGVWRFQGLTIDIEQVSVDSDLDFFGDEQQAPNQVMLSIGLPQLMEFQQFEWALGTRDQALRSQALKTQTLGNFLLDGKIKLQGKGLLFAGGPSYR
jgi:hypothetical protein